MRKVWQHTNDRCLRAAVAMVLDMDYRDVPDIGGTTHNSDFWGQWLAWLIEEQDLNVRFFRSPQRWDFPSGPWIAVVPVPDDRHAVAMVGDQFFHDPTRGEPLDEIPERIICGIELTRTDV
jgi:hypothetical protein